MFQKFFKKKEFAVTDKLGKIYHNIFSKYFIFSTGHDGVQVTRVYRNGQKRCILPL